MIKSMTGYGRGENEEQSRKFTVEMKSVNHRYNDISIKLPRSLNYMEDKIRKILMEKIFRGKTDVYIGFENFAADNVKIDINFPLADAYMEKMNLLEQTYKVTSNDKLSLLTRFPDIIVLEKQEEEEDIVWNSLYPALTQALESFLLMRQKEGEALKEDILKKADFIKQIVQSIKERSPFVVEDYRGRFLARLKDVLENIEIDEQRLMTEVMIFADRGCIDEEITRLESHISQLSYIFEKGGLVGRKLDFLIQEMNREANTIASKANDIAITKLTIELKSEIEKIREQIQNIE